MADAWIKMRTTLQDDPDVLKIAARLGLDEYSVCGRLLAVWGWADSVTADGFVPLGTAKKIDREADAEGFAEAMVSIGWLEIREDGVQFTKWEIHNSKSAKARAQDQKRKQLEREALKKTRTENRTKVGQKTGQNSDENPDKKPDTSSLLFSSLSESSLEEGGGEKPDPLFDPLPVGWVEQADEWESRYAEFVTLWKSTKGVVPVHFHELPADMIRLFQAVWSESWWVEARKALSKLRDGPPLSGTRIAMDTFLKPITASKITGGVYDWSRTDRKRVGLGAISETKSQGRGGEAPIGGPQVDL